MRSPAQYESTYNNQVKKFLNKTSYYIDNTQRGIYLQNTGYIAWLFAYCQEAINFNITTESTPENALDKIIILL